MNNVYENHIPPNFLHSILTNDSLYSMFKDDFENNIDYFQNRPKEIYVFEMEKYICSTLENSATDEANLNYYKRFYDDFILPKIEESNEYIFKVEIFKCLKYIYKSAKQMDNRENFLSLYNYVFASSKYFERCDMIISNLKAKMQKEKLSVQEYEVLTNYIKTTVDEYLPIDVSCLLIKNHIYKYNHIFDPSVVKKIVLSLAYDYLKKYGIKINIEYIDIILSKNIKTHDISSNTIYIESILIDTFISGNYVELLSSLFFKMTLFKDNYLLENNIVEVDTLKSIWRCVNAKVEMDKIFKDEKYHPYEYYSDMEANAFVMTLRFLENIGINLFENYLTSQTRDISFEKVEAQNSPKEISEEMKFINRFCKMEREKIASLRAKYDVLSMFYGPDGKRYKAIELINKCDNMGRVLVFEYLSTSIFEPIYLIDDIIDLTNQEFKDESIHEFVRKLSKYIYPDMFYYSLDSYILLNEDKISFSKNEYLDELYVRTSSIKETDDTRNFLKSALNAIELMKQK